MASFVLYVFARFVFWVYFSIFYKLKIIGRSYMPRKGPFIIASNHVSNFDPILLGVSSSRFLNYLAKDSLFQNKIHAWGLKKIMEEIAQLKTLHEDTLDT